MRSCEGVVASAAKQRVKSYQMSLVVKRVMEVLSGRACAGLCVTHAPYGCFCVGTTANLGAVGALLDVHLLRLTLPLSMSLSCP